MDTVQSGAAVDVMPPDPISSFQGSASAAPAAPIDRSIAPGPARSPPGDASSIALQSGPHLYRSAALIGDLQTSYGEASVVADTGEGAAPNDDLFLTSPALTASTPNLEQLTVTFPTAMQVGGANDLTDGAHYQLTGGLFLGAGKASAEGKSVTLTLACGSPCQRFNAGTQYVLTVSGLADTTGTLISGSTGFIAADATGPTLTLTQPGPFEILITSTEPLLQSTITPAAFTWDGAAFPGSIQAQGGDGTFCDTNSNADRCAQRIRLDLNVAFPAGPHTLGVIGITDLAGHAATPTSFSLTITGAPTVTSVTHFAVVGDPTQPPQSLVTVTFSAPMSSNAGLASSYTLSNPDSSPATTGGASGVGSPITIQSVSFDQKTQNTARFQQTAARLFLSGVLKPGVAYKLAPANIYDQGGIPLASTSMSLTVTNPGDTAPLTVTSVRSTGDQLFVSFNKPVFGNASRAGDPTAYTSAPQIVECSVGSSEAEGITAGPDGKIWFTDRDNARVGRITTGCAALQFFDIPGDPTNRQVPHGITSGPDGALWWVADSAFGTDDHVGRITTGGAITQYSVAGGFLGTLAQGPDGNLWFPQIANNTIGVMGTDGALLHQYPIPSGSSFPVGIAQGSDGNLWFTESTTGKIARITTAGLVTEFTIPTASSDPQFITAGADGNLWFTELQGNKIGKITPAGVFTEFAIPTAGSSPFGITAGPDGALWFTEDTGNKVGRITTAGVLTEYPVPTANAHPFGIASGPDGNIWFTERFSGKLGKVVVGSDATLKASLTGMTVASAGTAARLAYYGGPAFGNATLDGTGVVFGYATPLPSGTYTLLVSGVTDDLGNKLGPDPTPLAFTVETPISVPVTAATPNLAQVTVTFPTFFGVANPMQVGGANDATDGAHYQLSGGLFVGAGKISADGSSVTLSLGCVQTCQKFVSGTQYTLTVSGLAAVGGALVTGSTTFTAADTTAPTLALSQPGLFEIVLTANEPLAQSTITPAAFTFDGGAFTVQYQGGDNSFCDTNASGDRCAQRIRLVLTPPFSSGSHTLSVAGITDVAGNLAAPTSFPVTLSGAPTVTGTTQINTVVDPAQSAVGFVTVNFSTAMGPTAGFPSSYVLLNPDGTQATTGGAQNVGTFLTIQSVSYDGRGNNLARFQRTAARIFFSGPLKTGTPYTLQVNGVFDWGGIPLAYDSAVRTITVPASPTPLAVTSVRSSTSQLFVTFGNTVFSSATRAGDPTVYSAGDPGHPLSTDAALQQSLTGMSVGSAGPAARQAYYGASFFGNASLDSTGVTFNYSQPLAPGTYTVRISGVTDDLGNALLNDPTYATFTVTPVTSGLTLAVSPAGSATVAVGGQRVYTISATDSLGHSAAATVNVGFAENLLGTTGTAARIIWYDINSSAQRTSQSGGAGAARQTVCNRIPPGTWNDLITAINGTVPNTQSDPLGPHLNRGPLANYASTATFTLPASGHATFAVCDETVGDAFTPAVWQDLNGDGVPQSNEVQAQGGTTNVVDPTLASGLMLAEIGTGTPETLPATGSGGDSVLASAANTKQGLGLDQLTFRLRNQNAGVLTGFFSTSAQTVHWNVANSGAGTIYVVDFDGSSLPGAPSLPIALGPGQSIAFDSPIPSSGADCTPGGRDDNLVSNFSNFAPLGEYGQTDCFNSANVFVNAGSAGSVTVTGTLASDSSITGSTTVQWVNALPEPTTSDGLGFTASGKVIGVNEFGYSSVPTAPTCDGSFNGLNGSRCYYLLQTGTATYKIDFGGPAGAVHTSDSYVSLGTTFSGQTNPAGGFDQPLAQFVGCNVFGCAPPPISAGASLTYTNSGATSGPTTGTATHSITAAPNTSTGAPISVTPVDPATGTSPVTLTFSTVTSPGVTTVVSSTTGPAAPGGFTFQGRYYQIGTTAGFAGTVAVCLPYTGVSAPRLFHFNTTTSVWDDITTTTDTTNHIVCGNTTSFSPFVVGNSVTADISITKTASANSVTVGGTVNFTLTARNAGPGSPQHVTVTDHVPAALQVTIAMPTACTIAPSAQSSVSATLNVAGGSKPLGIAVDEPHNRLYVGLNSAHRVDAYDLSAVLAGGATPLASAVLPSSARPTYVVLNAHTGHLFVGDEGRNVVVVIDTTSPGLNVMSELPVANAPRGMAILPALDRVFAASYGANIVSLIQDGTTPAVTSQAFVGAGPGSWGIAADQTANMVWIPETSQGTVTALDETGAIVTTIDSVGNGGIDVDQATGKVYLGDTNSDQVWIIRGRSPTFPFQFTVVHSGVAGTNAVAVNTHAGHALVPTNAGLSVIDTATDTVASTFPYAGVQAVATAVLSSQDKVLVSNFMSDNVITLQDARRDTTVTCDLGAVAVGADATAIVRTKALYAGTSHNTASVTSDLTDPDTSNNSASADVTVAPPGVMVSGTVFDAASPTTTLAGVRVTAIDATCPFWGPACAQYTSSATDATGVYHVVVPAGLFKLFFQPAFASFYVGSFHANGTDFLTATTVNVTAATTVDHGLALGFRVSGHVSDPSGSAKPNVGVNAADASQPCCVFGPGGGTNASGDFSFAVPAETQWQIHYNANDPTLLQQWYPDQLTFAGAAGAGGKAGGAAGQERTGLNAQLHAGATLSGHVTDRATGNPVQGVNVRAFLPTIQPPDAIGDRRTGTDGYYSFAVPADTPVRVVFNGNDVGYLRRFYDGNAGGTPSFDAAANVTVPASGQTIDMALPVGIAVSGNVTNGTTGLANIGVSFQPTNGAPGTGANTDTTGHYTALVEAGSYTIFFQPNDPSSRYVAQYWNDKRTATTADVVDLTTAPTHGFDPVLVSGYFITGTIRDSVSNTPVAGVNMQAAAASCGQPDQSCEKYFMGPATDATGTYRVTVPAGTWRIGLFPGWDSFYVQSWVGGANIFQAARNVVVNADTTVDATLIFGMRLRGHVSSASATGLAGVGVSVVDATQPCCAFIGGVGTNGKPAVAAIGDFSFGVPAGSVKVSFTPPSPLAGQYYPNASRYSAGSTITGVAGQSLDGINAVLQNGFVVSGHLTDSTTGTDVVGAFVSATTATGTPFTDDIPGGSSTDGGGSFAFALATGSYRIFYNGSRVGHFNAYYSGTATATTDPNAAAVVTVGPDHPNTDGAIAPAFLITGHVFRPDGTTPLAGVAVRAVDPTQPCCVNLFGAQTDATGFYRLQVTARALKVKFLPPVPFVQQYWQNVASLDVATLLNVTGNVSGIDATVQSGFTFSGHVTDADSGQPLQGVNVNVRYSPQRSEPAGSVRTDSTGFYAVSVPAGTYREQFNGTNITPLHVSRYWNGLPGGVAAFRDAPDIVVSADQNKDMALLLGYRITGHITAPDGSHPANVQVTPFDLTQHADGTGWTTDPSGGGFFQLITAAGDSKVQITPINSTTTTYLPQWFDRARTFSGGATVTANATGVLVNGTPTTSIEVTLENGIRLTGQVVDATTGGGIDGISVNADLGGPSDACSPCTFENSATTANGGLFTIYVHTLTTYKVFTNGDASHLGQWYDAQPSFDAATSIPVQTTDVALNTIRLAQGIRVSGTVTAATQVSAFGASALALTGIAGIRVRAFAVDPSGACCLQLASTTTASDGHYSFVVPPGPFKLLFSSTPGVTYAATWSGGATDFLSASTLQAVLGTPLTVDMAMSPGFTVSGRVTDASSGAPVTPATARIHRADRGTTIDSVVDLEPTDASGSFYSVVAGGAFSAYKMQFGGTAQPYVRRFWNDKPSYDSSDSFTVLAPDPNKNAQLTLGVPVTASLKDRSTAAFIAGMVQAYDSSGRLVAFARAFAASGQFTGPITFNVPRGILTFAFSAPGYAPFTTAPIDTTVSPLPPIDALLDRLSTDLAVSIAGPTSAGVVNTFDTTVSVHNGGNQPTGGRLTHVLPAGLSVAQVIASQGACTGFDTGIGTCDVGTIQPGTDATFTVRSRAPQPGTFTQTATIAASGNDTNADNNAAALTTNVPADGVITGVAACGTVLPLATVEIFAGSLRLAVFRSAADGSYTLGLAPGITYTALYRGLSGSTSLSCAVRFTTAARGVTTVPTPAFFPDLGNHSYATARRLTNGTAQTDYLTRPLTSDWYVISVAQGQRITVDLTGSSGDLALALYGDIVATNNAAAVTVADTRLYGAAISPGTDALEAPGTDALDAPGTDALDAPGTDALDAPGTDALDAPGTDALDAPGTDALDAPGTDALDAPGTDALDAPGTDALDAPGGASALGSGDYSSEVKRSLLALSATRGAGVPERIVRQTFDRAGDYYIRVLGQASASPFNVTATVVDSECVNVTLTKTPASWPAGRPVTTPKTLIVLNSGALRKADGTLLAPADVAALMGLLQQFAARPEVGGAILDLALDAGFMQDMAQWNANQSCAQAANVAAEALRDMIAEYRKTAPAALEYVVIVGPNDSVPHRLEPDRALLGSETQYAPPVADQSRSQAQLRRGKVATDDYYAASAPISKLGELLYVPDLAVGRLVETYEDVTAAVSAYLETRDGVIELDPAAGAAPRALVTSYDFLAALGDSFTDSFSRSGMTVDQLQAPLGVKPTDPGAWSADDLRAKLLGPGHYDVIGLNAHFSSSTAWAADLSTLSVTDLAAINDGRYKHTLVLSNGCHAGYVVLGPDAVPGVTQKIDWAATFVRQGANLIAGTGYMYGGVQLLNFDQVILANAVARLRLGTGPVAIGKALAGAKQDYVSAYPSALDATDLKALREIVLYGFPMMKYDLGGRVVSPAPQAVQPQSVAGNAGLSVTEVRAGAGEVSSDAPGLSTRPYTLGRHDLILPVTGGGSATVSYYDADGRTSSTAGHPVLPKSVIDVATPGAAVLGAVLTAADITRVPNWHPFTDATATDAGSTYPNYVNARPYPQLPFSLSLLAGQSLVLEQMQYRSDGTSLTGTATRYDHMTLRVYATTATGAAATLAPPTFTTVQLVQVGTAARIIAVVAAPADIQEVFATYTADAGADAGHFRSIRLVGGPNLVGSGTLRVFSGDIETGSTDLPAAYRVFLQAVGSNGAVGVALNNGDLYRITPPAPAVAPALAPPKDTALALDLTGGAGSPPTVPFGATLVARATLTEAVGGAPVAGKTVTFSLGGRTAAGTTDATGAATANLPVTDAPGTERATVAFFGDTAYGGSGTSIDVTVVRAPTSFATTPVTVDYSDGAPIAQLSTATKILALAPVIVSVGPQSVATLTDPYGRVLIDTRALALGRGTSSVGLSYPGSVTFAETTASVSVTVNPEHATLAFSTVPVATGRTVSVTTTVVQQADGSAGDLTRAAVQYVLTSGSVVIRPGPIPVAGDGTATATVTVPQAGTYTVQATVVGDFFSSVAAATTVTVSRFGQTITIAQAAPASAAYLSTFTVAATAPGGPVGVAGTGSCSGSGSGTATIAMTSGSGTCTVTYTQAGSVDYDPASSSSATTALPVVGLLVLNPTAKGALNVSGGAKITVTNTDLVVDSSASTGATISGGSTVTVTGGVIKTATGTVSGTFSGTLVQGTVSDPLAGYPKPNTAGIATGSTYRGADGVTHYRPGIYPGITVSSTVVVLDPGLFVLRGGGLAVSGGGSISGNGVTIFNTGASYPSGGSCGKIDLSGASTYTLNSPTANIYSDSSGRGGGMGLVLFQDPACTTTITLSGGSSAVADGTIYAPTAPMAISGGSALLRVQAIVSTLTVSGSKTNITFDPDRIAKLPG